VISKLHQMAAHQTLKGFLTTTTSTHGGPGSESLCVSARMQTYV
jgi:hypothetical protein